MRQPSRLPITAGRVLAGGRGARLGGSSCAPLRDPLQAGRRAMHRRFGALGAGKVSFAEVDAFRHINEPAQSSFTLPRSA